MVSGKTIDLAGVPAPELACKKTAVVEPKICITRRSLQTNPEILSFKVEITCSQGVWSETIIGNYSKLEDFLGALRAGIFLMGGDVTLLETSLETIAE